MKRIFLVAFLLLIMGTASGCSDSDTKSSKVAFEESTDENNGIDNTENATNRSNYGKGRSASQQLTDWLQGN